MVAAAVTTSSPAASAAEDLTVRMVHGTFAGTVRNSCVPVDGANRYACDIEGASVVCSEAGLGSGPLPIGTDCPFAFESAYDNLTFTRDCSGVYTAAGFYYSGLLGTSFGYLLSVKQVGGQGSATASFVDAGGQRVGTVSIKYATACVTRVSSGVLSGTFDYVSPR